MKYREILEAAIRAPSGDNCQPWRVEINGDTVNLYNVPKRDTSLYNYRQRASLVAHGAFLENLSIASKALGYFAKIETFPDPDREDFVAAVQLKEDSPKDDPLYPCIGERTINRRRYRKEGLSESDRNALEGAAANVLGGRLVLVEDPGMKSRLARVIGLNDRIVFENRDLHGFLFDHLRWSEGEAVATGDGLDVRTLELALPDALAFRIFKHYGVVRVLNGCGLSRIIQKKGRDLADSSTAIGVIIMPGAEPTDYLAAGRIMERIWLETTHLKLAFHLTTGLTFLMQRVLEGETQGLSPGHAKLINFAREEAALVCKVGNERIHLMFRMGRCKPPSVKSLRLPLEKVIK